MNWDRVEGSWKQYRGAIKENWGKLTDDHLDMIDGKRQQLVGRIQEHYGIAKDAAEQQVNDFLEQFDETGTPANRSRVAAPLK
jgi:uncharacterized protein YjbJ (UPF0337 family)